MIIHVAEHRDTSAQAELLANALRSAGISVRVYGARASYHTKVNEDIGLPDDPGTKALFEFIGTAFKK